MGRWRTIIEYRHALWIAARSTACPTVRAWKHHLTVCARALVYFDLLVGCAGTRRGAESSASSANGLWRAQASHLMSAACTIRPSEVR